MTTIGSATGRVREDQASPALHSRVATSANATMVNGFHETWPIVYGEEAHGFAKTGQTILNVTDAKIIKLYVDDEPFYLPTASLLEYERALDMRAGTLDRTILWETAAGKRVSIKSRRLVSLEHRHLAASEYEVTVVNAEAPVIISSKLIHEPEDEAEDDDDPGMNVIVFATICTWLS